MAIKTIEQLKAFFRRGMYPTEQNFTDLIDSFVHRGEKIIVKTNPSSVLVKTNPDTSFVDIPAATTGSAGVMSASDKEKVDRIEDIEQTAVGAINNIDTEQIGGTLGLYIERGEDDYTLPLPLATETMPGIMSPIDKAKLKTLSNESVRGLRLEVNSSGGMFLEYATPYGPATIPLPTATPSANGLMSSRDYDDLRRVVPIADNLAARNFEHSAQFAFRKGVWVRLAEWRNHVNALGNFTLRLRHLRFAGSINFTAFCSNVDGALYQGMRAGNLQFIDRIAIATERSSRRTYLYARLSEQLTEPTALPTLELLTQGIGWDGLTPTPITGEVNDVTHSGRTELFVTSISHTATERQEGLMSAADKRKLDATASSLTTLNNTTSTHFEQVYRRLDETRALIPIGLDIVKYEEGDDTRNALRLIGDIPEGYMPIVFRKIRRTTKIGRDGYPFPSQWYFYGTADIVSGRPGYSLLAFNHPRRDDKLKAPYTDHNHAPTMEGKASAAHDFVLVHNVDAGCKAGGLAGYPKSFRLRVAWGRAGRRNVFTSKNDGALYPATICLELGVGLVKKDVYQQAYGTRTRERRITMADLASNFITFRVVTQKPEIQEWEYAHTYKPFWYFST